MAESLWKKTCPNSFVAAIDIGTTFSGYAFSGKDDFEKDPLEISVNNWNAGTRSLITHKAPTSLLLYPHKSFKSFGYQAEDEYAYLAQLQSDEDDSDEEGEKEDFHKYYYFHRFKMILHNNKDVERNTKVDDETGKPLDAIEVFQHSIRYLKDHLYKSIKESCNDISPEDIKYVLTVPAIWNDNAKQFMREAADKAGISSENLTIALEPEAASLYCQRYAIADDDKKNVKKTSKSSNIYMVVDIGGGTVDTTVHEKQSDGSLKELHAATGGAFGGKCVDDAYRGFLEELVGKTVIEDFKDKCMDDYIDLFREFETKKRTVAKDKPPKVVMTMPVTLSDIVKRKCKKPMKTVVGESSFGNSVNFDKQKLHISNSELIKLFQPTIDGIIKHMEGMLYDSRYSHVKNILMVGGFSDCELLQDAIHNRFDQKMIIIPEDAGLAVLKGAVLHGHIPPLSHI